MKEISPEEIKTGDQLVLITYHSGDNPILCTKADFNIDTACISPECTVLEITVNKVFSVKKTFSLVEKHFLLDDDQ